MPISEGALALLLVSVVLVGSFAWMTARTLRLPTSDPNRLVAELRLAQFGATLLALVAGASLGVAALNEARSGIAVEGALTLGLFAIAVVAPLRDPREALLWLVAGFAAHAGLAALHRPGGLFDELLLPRWFLMGNIIQDVCLGALCYLPLLRR